MLEAYLTLFYSPSESSLFYKSSFLKHLCSFHFNRDIPSYYTKLGPLSLDEAVMKDEMYSWFHALGYEDEFGIGEVPSTKVRKRRIDT